jgi:predicted enzyme related to lactoylglutathione lyase
MYTANYLSPMIPSYNLEKTVSFFVDLFDFKIARDYTTYFILYKDNLTLHIQPAGTDIGEMSFYLAVDNIEEVWQGIKDKLGDMKVRAPFDREYGMREIHVIVPETKTLMFIGQEIV